MRSVTILTQVGESWDLQNLTADEFLRHNSRGIEIIFAQLKLFLTSDSLRQSVSTHYLIPHCFWSEACQRSNGFFGCSDTFDDSRKLQSHNTWFRFLVKQIGSGSVHHREYEWYEMAFFTRWTSPNLQVLLCFDVPQNLYASLKSMVLSSSWTLDSTSMYSLHAMIIDELLKLYDTAIWSLRDVIRGVELNRAAVLQQEPNFSSLHDFTRHAIHSSETLDVATETMTSMVRQHEWFSNAGQPYVSMDVIALRHTRQYLDYQLQMIRSLRARSKANEERLRNEIALAYNTIAQNDSKITVRISESVRRDSAAMKTVAILTLTFLPATYVSSVFSMSFFNFSPINNNRPGDWIVSEKFWLYWAVSFPLTIITIALWLFWQKRNSIR